MNAEKETNDGCLKWPPLIPGILIRRYKRFLADVELENGRSVTAHCPNTGSMKGCSEPGRPVYVSFHDDPKRKLNYTWQLIRMSDSLVGVNTLVPNRLLELSIRSGTIPEFGFAKEIRREVAVGNRSRIDLMLLDAAGRACYIEIKNCTLVENGIARFPDAVTSRGVKHLIELERLRATGHRCFMFYFIQRMDACIFKPADHIDPEYARILRRVSGNGVDILAYDVDVGLDGIRLRQPVPCEL